MKLLRLNMVLTFLSQLWDLSVISYPHSSYFIPYNSTPENTSLQICSQVCGNETAVMDLQGLPTLFGWSANSGQPSHRYRHWWARIISPCFHTAKHSLVLTNTHTHTYTCSKTNRHTHAHRQTCKCKTHIAHWFWGGEMSEASLLKLQRSSVE